MRPPTIPSGAFTGSAQTLPLRRRQQLVRELPGLFAILNTQLVPAGTFTGRATFTLTAAMKVCALACPDSAGLLVIRGRHGSPWPASTFRRR